MACGPGPLPTSVQGDGVQQVGAGDGVQSIAAGVDGTATVRREVGSTASAGWEGALIEAKQAAGEERVAIDNDMQLMQVVPEGPSALAEAKWASAVLARMEAGIED